MKIQKLTNKIFLLGCFFTVLIPGLVFAQDLSKSILSMFDFTDFPIVHALLDVRDGNGGYVSGLTINDVAIIEDDQHINPFELTEVRPGAQIAIAVNSGDPFLIRGVEGITRYQRAFDTISDWIINSAELNLDALSLITNNGIIVEGELNPHNWYEYFSQFSEDANFSQLPTLTPLSTAIDVVSNVPPRAGMGKVVVFITPSLTNEFELALSSMIERAVQSDIKLVIIILDSLSLIGNQFDQMMTEGALQTGGAIFHFSESEVLPDINSLFEPYRRCYEISYVSQVNSTGSHIVFANIGKNGNIAMGSPMQFEISVESPNPIFLDPPNQIVRSVPEELEMNEENLTPTEFQFEYLVEFPDGFVREIVSATIYINNLQIELKNDPPFDTFIVDLTQFPNSEQLLIRIEVTDELGMVGSTIELPVQLTVSTTRKSIGSFLSLNAQTITVGSIILIGILFLLILLAQVKPRLLQTRMKNRERRLDPVTQPLSDYSEIGDIELDENISQSQNIWKRRFKWINRNTQLEPIAYLTPIIENGNVTNEPIFSITHKKIAIGSDAAKVSMLIEDAAIEKIHTKIWRDNQGDFWVADQNTVAGTWVNFAPITLQGCRIQHQDILHIGKKKYRFTIHNHTLEGQPQITFHSPPDKKES